MITPFKLAEVCKRLNYHNVKYILIGGCAMYLHGYERTTQDIDFLVDVAVENIDAIKTALSDLMPEASAELSEEDVVQNVVVRMVGEDLIVDLLGKVGKVDYAMASRDVSVEKMGDVDIPFAGLDTMLDLKGGVRDTDKRDYLFLKGKKEYLSKK